MTPTTLLMIPVLGLISLLSACAAMPKPDPQQAWIGLKEDTQGTLLAEKLDGARLNDGRFFEVQPGAHRLNMTLIADTNGGQNAETCTARITYPQFQAGQHYNVVETSGTEGYTAELEDAHGQQLGKMADFKCWKS